MAAENPPGQVQDTDGREAGENIASVLIQTDEGPTEECILRETPEHHYRQRWALDICVSETTFQSYKRVQEH